MTIRILAFNTVTELCSVALMIDHKVYNHCMLTPRLHAEHILFMINKLLIDTGVSLRSLDCIIFDQGPGSFIGVRLGLSIAQGLALGLNLPLISVSSLSVLAQGAWRVFSATHVVTTIHAYMNTLYWACYKRQTYNNNNKWICINDACLVTVSIAKKMIHTLQGKWSLVGTGWNMNQQLISYIDNKIDIFILKKIMLPEAQDMLLLGISLYHKKIFLSPTQVKPMYLCTNIIQKND